MKNVKWILLAVVLCLGLIGGAYAFWAEEIVVRGTVETGNIDVKFVEKGLEGAAFHTSDSAPGAKDPRYNGAHVWTSSNSFTDTRFTLSLDDTYPGLSYLKNVEVKNEGSIPVRLIGIDIYRNHGGSRTLETSSGVGFKHNLGGWLTVAIKDPTTQDNTNTGTGQVITEGGIVLGDGESHWFELGAHTKAGKDAPQNGTMRYEIELKWEQWVTDDYSGDE